MHRFATNLASSAYARAHDAGGAIHPAGKPAGWGQRALGVQ